ncbi:MAG TPA: L,D-transpeptidase [Ktedonobacteraceae bacterium]|nr:L,D-transpeptidase [Ktedonobacteraceae bacterium]
MHRIGSFRSTHIMLAGMLVGMMLLISACGGSSQSQAQLNQNKAMLDQTLQHARSIGIPESALQSIIKQEQRLSSTRAPFSLFNDQPVTDYNSKLASNYQQLETQTEAIVSSITDQYNVQAQQDLQFFQSSLSALQQRKVGNKQAFTAQYNKDSSLLAAAHYPKDYAAISNDARKAIEALALSNTTFNQLNTFNTTIHHMKAARLDVTAMQTQYQNDLATFNNATTSIEFQNLGTLVNAQYQEAVVNSIQALPFVSSAKIGEFKSQLALLKLYGMDASSYQSLYKADQAVLKKTSTISGFLAISQKIDADIASMHDDLVQGASHYLIKALDHEANAWGNAHAYHDKFDGKNYMYTAGYTLPGIGFWFNRELGWTYLPSDYQAVVDEENNEFFNLHMLEQDYSDSTPYNQVHATDKLMMQHYPSLQHGTVLMVSQVEQALRFYKDGKLIRSFHVTTGRVERPALPGVWTVQDRKSPDEFKSTDPPGSPYWYPPTPIQYAILYHWGGFFVHDAWWRVNFGPGTQFPHYDVGGDESFAGNGSHGCVNLQSNEAAWVYANTDWNTQIAMY